MGAEVLHFKFECVLGATAGALKGHVFEEVSGAVRRVRLGARASIYPHTDSRGLCMWMCFCRNSKAI